MMLNLLKERFGLTFHWETRVVSAYELVQDKGGAKLDAPFKDLPGYPAAEYGPMIRRAKGEDSLLRLTCSECTLPFIRRELLRQFAPVVDKTGLTGKYNFHLEYAPDDLMGAIRQVGLRLIRAKLPLEFVVIDHLERQPTEN